MEPVTITMCVQEYYCIKPATYWLRFMTWHVCWAMVSQIVSMYFMCGIYEIKIASECKWMRSRQAPHSLHVVSLQRPGLKWFLMVLGRVKLESLSKGETCTYNYHILSLHVPITIYISRIYLSICQLYVRSGSPWLRTVQMALCVHHDGGWSNCSMDTVKYTHLYYIFLQGETIRDTCRTCPNLCM